MIGEIFYWIFNMSLAATICMIPVLLCRLIKKIPRRIFIWLWLIPFIRMVIPFGITSKYGIMHLISKFTTKTVTILEIYDDSALTMMNHLMGANSYFPITYKVNLLEDVFNIASIVWVGVTFALFVLFCAVYYTGVSESKRALHFKDNVFLSSRINIPSVYGIINPKIIIPAKYKMQNIDYILMHENAHIKRKDNIIRLLAVAVGCIHWFNPFSWIMIKFLFTDIELACDEAVLMKCNEKQIKEYANEILYSAEKSSVFLSAFGGAKIKTRIENIVSYKKISLFSSIAFSILVMWIFYVLLTNAS